MKTTGREFFYSVSGLMVPKYIVSDKLTAYINEFIELVPAKTDEMEQFIKKNMTMKGFIQEMENLYRILCFIHAHWLEVEAARILRLAEVNKAELCRTLLMPFITGVRTLAIDIQMAQSSGDDIYYRMRGETERYKDVVSSMKVIVALLKNADYKNALDIAKNINELQDSSYIRPLITLINAKDKLRALDLAEGISEVYRQKIDGISQTAKTKVQKKIVVVDDMPEILTVVSYMLKEHYQVLPFKDGKEALKAVEYRHQPDAFLLDVDMPEMDGFALADKIRQNPAYKETPVLFLTANSTRENLIKSIQFKPKAFIVKPVNKDMLLARLISCLEA